MSQEIALRASTNDIIASLRAATGTNSHGRDWSSQEGCVVLRADRSLNTWSSWWEVDVRDAAGGPDFMEVSGVTDGLGAGSDGVEDCSMDTASSSPSCRLGWKPISSSHWLVVHTFTTPTPSKSLFSFRLESVCCWSCHSTGACTTPSVAQFLLLLSGGVESVSEPRIFVAAPGPALLMVI